MSLHIGKAGRRRFLLPIDIATQVHDSEEAKDFAARLRAQVSVDGERWIWTGYTRNGYGSIQRRGVNLYTHRLSYELYVGPVPDGLFVCHRCDRRRCIRPYHLFVGTAADNIADMEAKGRARKVSRHGIANGNATLTESQVGEIRGLVAEGAHQRTVARRYGCSQSTVWRISHGLTRARG